MMEAIEPYEYQDLTEFNMSYLSGYMADKYDQEPDELTGRVYERMEQSVKDCFERFDIFSGCFSISTKYKINDLSRQVSFFVCKHV